MVQMCDHASVKEFSDAVALLEDLQTENEHLVANSGKARHQDPVLCLVSPQLLFTSSGMECSSRGGTQSCTMHLVF